MLGEPWKKPTLLPLPNTINAGKVASSFGHKKTFCDVINVKKEKLNHNQSYFLIFWWMTRMHTKPDSIPRIIHEILVLCPFCWLLFVLLCSNNACRVCRSMESSKSIWYICSLSSLMKVDVAIVCLWILNF